MRENSGFTLVELLVALAISAIAGTLIFGFFSYSSKNYSRTNQDVSLQYEQQLVINQIRDLLVEVNGAVSYDNGKKQLVIYDEEKHIDAVTGAEQTRYPVTVVAFNQTEQKLYINQKQFESVTGIAGINLTTIPKDTMPAEHITDFSVDLSKLRKRRVTFSITFLTNGVEKEVVSEVSIRNNLLKSDDLSDIYDEPEDSADSFIESITIQRGNTVFPAGGSDTIGTNHAAVSAQYKATVKATTEYSTREYGVNWVIMPIGGSDTTGISVANGLVNISSGVSGGTSFLLRAVSVDDATKYAEITIEVVDTYAYPESLTLSQNPEGGTLGNGDKTYTIVPTIHYKEVTPAREDNNNPGDCIFSISPELPKGCTFNPQTGVLYLKDSASNMTFTVTALTREEASDGNPLKEVMVIEVGEIKPYSEQQTMLVNGNDTLNRNGRMYFRITWDNLIYSTQYYEYQWKIEPVYESEGVTFGWGTGSRNRFEDMIGLKAYTYSTPSLEVTTNGMLPVVMVECKSQLDWNKTFQFKMSVTAIQKDKDGKQLAEPVTFSRVVTIYPVKVSVAETMSEFSNNSDNYPTDTEIQFLDRNNHEKKNTRIVKLNFDNLVPNSSVNQGYKEVVLNCTFANRNKEILDEELTRKYHNQIQSQTNKDSMTFLREFFRLHSWYGNWMQADTTKVPYYIYFDVTVSDDYGNTVSSNDKKEFAIQYN